MNTQQITLKTITHYQPDGIVCNIPLQIMKNRFFQQDKVFLKIENYSPSSVEDRVAGKKDGFRFWVNINSPVLDPNISVDSNIQVIQIKKISADINQNFEFDTFEIPPPSYKILFDYFIKHQEKRKNKNNHITLDDIRSINNNKKNNEFWVPVTLNQQFINSVEEQTKVSFLNVEDNLLVEMTDLSSMDFKLKSNFSQHDKDQISSLLEELYLPDQSNYESIREWLQIDNFLDGRYPFNEIGNKCGIILYGPPGTGKTFTATQVLKQIFVDKFEMEFIDFTLSEILGGERSGTVGGFAFGVSNLIIRRAIKEIRRTKKPVIVFVDEGTDLIKDTSGGGTADNWIKEGQEILKNYFNPERYPGVLFVVATNLERDSLMNNTIAFERLNPILFPFPNKQRATKLFKNYFLIQLSGQKSISPFRDKNLDEASSELGDIAGDNVSVRAIKYFIDYMIKSNSIPTRNLTFDQTKNIFIDKAIEIIKRDIGVAQEKLRRKPNNIEIEDEIKSLNKSIEILDIIKQGKTFEQVNQETFQRTIKIHDINFVRNEFNSFKQIFRDLINQIQRTSSITSSVIYINSTDFLKKLLFIIDVFEDNTNISVNNKEEVINKLRLLNSIISNLIESYNSNQQDLFDQKTIRILVSTFKLIENINF